MNERMNINLKKKKVPYNILHVLVTLLLLLAVYSAAVGWFSFGVALYPARPFCTLPCSTHVTTRALELIHHVAVVRQSYSHIKYILTSLDYTSVV